MVFRCHDDMEVGARRCPENPPEAGQCALGYAGYLCSSCAADYGMMTTRRCELCDDVGYTPKSMMMLGGIIVGLTLFGILFAKYWKVFPAKYAVRCAFQPMRIFITCECLHRVGCCALGAEYLPACRSCVIVAFACSDAQITSQLGKSSRSYPARRRTHELTRCGAVQVTC
jgi:hypothetical protein